MATCEYWLQLENHPWGVVPWGIDRMSGQMLAANRGGQFRPLPGEALMIRRYTAQWASPADQPVNPWDLNEPDPTRTSGSIPGATIEGKVGDELIVHFRNMDMRKGLPVAERIIAAWFVGWAGWAGGMYFSKSWEEIRLGMQLNILFGVSILISIVGFWSEFNFSQFSTRSYALGALVLTAALAYFYWRQEGQRG